MRNSFFRFIIRMIFVRHCALFACATLALLSHAVAASLPNFPNYSASGKFATSTGAFSASISVWRYPGVPVVFTDSSFAYFVPNCSGGNGCSGCVRETLAAAAALRFARHVASHRAPAHTLFRNACATIRTRIPHRVSLANRVRIRRAH